MAKIKRIDTPEATAEQPTAAPKLKKLKDKKSENAFETIERFLLDEYEFRLNEISVEIEVTDKGAGVWETLNENNIYLHLYRCGFKGFKAMVDVLLKNDYTRAKYNPVVTYFNSLPAYDPTTEPDYIDNLLSFIEVEPNETAMFRTQIKKHLVRTVAAGIGLLKFNKQCPVLQGKQNDGKSSFIRYLVPDFLGSKYYTDSFDPENKDDVKRLATCLLINIDEMAGLSNRDTNKIKSKMSYESVKMRLPYDKSDSDLRRIASFWGTTNDDEFLSDATGSVRWLVFKVLSINHDFGGANGYQSIPIDKVWGQALYLLKNAFDYKMSDEELKEVEKTNRNFQVSTSEMQYIQRYFEPCEIGDPEGVVLQSTEIIDFVKAQHRDLNLNAIMVGKALTFLKFEHGQKMSGKFQVKGRWCKYINQPAPPTSFPTVEPTPLSKKPPVTDEKMSKVELLESKKANILANITKAKAQGKPTDILEAALLEVNKDIVHETKLPF